MNDAGKYSNMNLLNGINLFLEFSKSAHQQSTERKENGKLWGENLYLWEAVPVPVPFILIFINRTDHTFKRDTLYKGAFPVCLSVR